MTVVERITMERHHGAQMRGWGVGPRMFLLALFYAVVAGTR
jgi:hypothetical protein